MVNVKSSQLVIMIVEFEGLESEEIDALLKAPILVCILLAGADDKIDRSEIKEAVNIAESKRKKARKNLLEYYDLASQDFEDKLKFLLSQFPSDASARNPLIVAELEQLNEIFDKLDPSFAKELYQSLKDIAKKIAEASGGILGYMSVGYEESKFIDLKMLKNPAQS